MAQDRLVSQAAQLDAIGHKVDFASSRGDLTRGIIISCLYPLDLVHAAGCNCLRLHLAASGSSRIASETIATHLVFSAEEHARCTESMNLMHKAMQQICVLAPEQLYALPCCAGHEHPSNCRG